MQTAERELEAQPEFARVVVNDRLEQATDELGGSCATHWLRREGADVPLTWRADRSATATPDEGLNTVISPRIDKLLEHVDSDYASVVVAAKRARQINSYYHNLGEGTFDEFPPPMVDTRSKNYLTIALEEVAQGKLKYHYR